MQDEFKRRANPNNSLTPFAKSFTTTPAAGGSITAEQGDVIKDSFLYANDLTFDDGTKLSDLIIAQGASISPSDFVETIRDALTSMATFSITANVQPTEAGCRGSCSGLCAQECYGSCTGC